jgi:hypothetical protein
MINAERFKEEILNIVNDDFYISVNKNNPNGVSKCGSFPCTDCMFSKLEDGKIRCTKNRMNWLLAEYKEPVKLTRLEYELLKWMIEKNYKCISRDSDGQLNVYYDKPVKDESYWKTNKPYYDLDLLSNLFQFVKWEDEEPTSIQEVLKNCAVENIKEEQ